MVILAMVAHPPAVGVNVYVVVAVLLIVGDHIPVIPLVEVVGNEGKMPPVQIAATELNVGVMLLLTTTVMVATDAHCPVAGVKVYVVVAVLFKAGDQVPVMPLVEVVGNGDTVLPAQMADTGVNAGNVFPGFTVMVSVAVVAH
jgi:hypothetical protein